MTDFLHPAEFERLFDTFEHTVFRLETRDRYNEAYESESLDKFVAGEPDDLPWLQGWADFVRTATAAGRRFRRVRVVSLPLTDYSRFGVWCAHVTTGAGEDIRYVLRDHADALPNHDYGLFDSRALVRMHYDDGDSFLGGELVQDAATIVQHSYWRDAAWHHAVPRGDFAARHDVAVV